MQTELINQTQESAARPSDLRQSNRRSLLRLIRESVECSKADLVRWSGLSAPTVSSAVQDLQEAELIEVLGEGRSSGGRPPEMLRFNATYGYVAGADIGGTRVRMMLSDLGGRAIAQWTSVLQPNRKDPHTVVRLLHQGLRSMCAEAKIKKSRVRHITVGAPGVTDVDRGIIRSAPNLTEWNQVPLRELVQEEIQVPAITENDTNLAAVGEHSMGSAKGVEDFVFIAIGTGVGAGIFLGGRLHHGSAWSAGEIGYLPVHGLSRQVPLMKETGQLERTIGGEGIEKNWRSALAHSKRSDRKALARLRGGQIFDRAKEGDADAVSVLTGTSQILADAIATITFLFNPLLVVLGGGIGSHVCLRKKTEELLNESDFAHPCLRTSELGTQAQLYGTIALSLEAVEGKLLC